MKPLLKIEEIEKFIAESGFRLVYFASESCSVCKSMRQEVATHYQDQAEMDLRLVMIEDVPEARGHYQVFAAPTIHVYFDGQRVYEAGRFLRLEKLDQMIERIIEINKQDA
jgi:thioredoxin-like negative regulator of GroEL